MEQLALALKYRWTLKARPNQLAPAWNWFVWLILAGRGFGKTRSGGEWVRGLVEQNLAGRIALIAPTAADARDVMVEGESGILAISPPWNRPKYEPTKRRLTWHNGAIATTYSADEPERLRGPQHDAGWADELCSWRYPLAWDMFLFGLRLGLNPRAVVTTTPKPVQLLRDIRKDPTTHTTRGSTYDNRANLAANFFAHVVAKYEGTRLGDQELYGRELEDTPGALWTAARLEILRVNFLQVPKLVRIVVGVDPSVSDGSTEGAAEMGIVVVGKALDGQLYVLADYSTTGSPLERAKAAIKAYNDFQADCLVVEVNQGGDWIPALIRATEGGEYLRIKAVHASRGKYTRAEPIAGIYEQGKAHHVGSFGHLESQMCTFVPGAKSPDRLDAMVWGATELTEASQAQPTRQANYLGQGSSSNNPYDD